MTRPAIRYLVLTLSLLATTALRAQTERDRSRIPEQYKWNLTDLYPSDEAWRQAKEKAAARIPELAKFKGTLSSSPRQLVGVLDLENSIDKDVNRLFVYAGLGSDQDTRDAKFQAEKQEMTQLANDFTAAASWIEPEILRMDRAAIDSALSSEPRLAVYRHYLDDVLRRKAHTRSEGEERIIADAGLMAPAPSEIYGIFSNADFPYPTITLSDGKKVKLDPAAFTLARTSANREDRRKVFAAFFGSIGDYSRTFGTTMNANIQKDIFYARSRNYPTSVESSLDASAIPVGVYTSLVDGVNANLPTFHRYLKLRKRMMKLSELHYYDLYAPLVGGVDLSYPVAEAQKNIYAALAPLGSDYVDVLKRAFAERWIDLYPNTGKRSGAYSNGGAYDVHPYMLINFNGRYDDMSTLAHELGHTMQSYFSNKTQPYPLAGYPIFVAEVASTFNESLLIDHMLKAIKDPKTRLSLLGNYLENIKGTVFRQTQFAEFELRAHQMAEKGEPITGESLDKLYMEITKKYYGHDAGVCVVDPEIAHEWAYIPHFYRGFYVFQYATSFTASAALSEKVLTGDSSAVKRYRDFLGAGGSKYPIDLLKDAGVDMTTSEPLDLTVKKMNRIMGEMEQLLDEMKTK
jgi:oligoendopeptidase F